MKTRLLALAICSLTLSAGAFADDKAKDAKKDAVVSELDVTLLRGEFPVFERKQIYLVLPISAEVLPKVFPNEEAQTRLKKEVDFTKQKLLLITWYGRGDDKLTYTVEKGEKGPVVMFHYQSGKKKTKKNDPDSKKEPDVKYEPFAKKDPESQVVRAFAISKDTPCYTQGWPYVPDRFTIPK